ncbi:NAD(P)-binding protein, partial [candidate division WOR-3 bacterium]|nr:NAD(P)-binding protein [candidate division WOR-3 bacterium]
MPEKVKTAIAGGGLSGLVSACFLQKSKIPYKLFEKEERFGGLCRSLKRRGYIFDYTGHLLHFSRKDVKKFVSGLGLNLLRHERKAFILISGKMIPYPFQANIACLEPEMAYESLVSFLERDHKKKYKDSYEMFSGCFGKTMADLFFRPYNKKLWTTEPSEMSTEWAGRFVPRVSVEDVLRPFIFRDAEKKYGYNSVFYYPEGGIERLPEAIGEKLKAAFTGEKIKKIFYREKKIETDRRVCYYDNLIYTIPLNEFPAYACPPLKGKTLTAFSCLKAAGVLDLEYGMRGKSPDYHWVYLPEKKYLPYRVGCSSNFYGKRRDHFSIYAEISFGPTKKLPGNNTKNIALKVLDQMKEAEL